MTGAPYLEARRVEPPARGVEARCRARPTRARRRGWPGASASRPRRPGCRRVTRNAGASRVNVVAVRQLGPLAEAPALLVGQRRLDRLDRTGLPLVGGQRLLEVQGGERGPEHRRRDVERGPAAVVAELACGRRSPPLSAVPNRLRRRSSAETPTRRSLICGGRRQVVGQLHAVAQAVERRFLERHDDARRLLGRRCARRASAGQAGARRASARRHVGHRLQLDVHAAERLGLVQPPLRAVDRRRAGGRPGRHVDRAPHDRLARLAAADHLHLADHRADAGLDVDDAPTTARGAGSDRASPRRGAAR